MRWSSWPGYRWTLWQSEWATDLVFDSPGSVAPLMDSLLRHELANGTGGRVLRYFGRPVRPGGQPHPLADPDILSRAGVWYDGVRMKHWLDGNSVKFYNEHNALRFETTLGSLSLEELAAILAKRTLDIAHEKAWLDPDGRIWPK